MIPPYFRQESHSTCSLAVLRMVLKHFGRPVNESDLLKSIQAGYGSDFKNIWNSTICKLARQFGIEVKMYALWPLFKPKLLARAKTEFATQPKVDLMKYEHPGNKDEIPESMQLAYQEMLAAIKLGCRVTYGGLTEIRLKRALDRGGLVQASINLQAFYGDMPGFHALLLYGYAGDRVHFHDPARGAKKTANFDNLIKALLDEKPAIIYEGLAKST